MNGQRINGFSGGSINLNTSPATTADDKKFQSILKKIARANDDEMRCRKKIRLVTETKMTRREKISRLHSRFNDWFEIQSLLLRSILWPYMFWTSVRKAAIKKAIKKPGVEKVSTTTTPPKGKVNGSSKKPSEGSFSVPRPRARKIKV